MTAGQILTATHPRLRCGSCQSLPPHAVVRVDCKRRGRPERRAGRDAPSVCGRLACRCRSAHARAVSAHGLPSVLQTDALAAQVGAT